MKTLRRILGVDPDSAEMAEETLESEQNLVAKAGFSPEVATLLVNNRAVLTTELINTVLARHAAGLASQPSFSRAVRFPTKSAELVGSVNARGRRTPRLMTNESAPFGTSTPENPGRRLASRDVHEPRGHDCMPNVPQGNALQTSTDRRVLL